MRGSGFSLTVHPLGEPGVYTSRPFADKGNYITCQEGHGFYLKVRNGSSSDTAFETLVNGDFIGGYPVELRKNQEATVSGYCDHLTSSSFVERPFKFCEVGMIQVKFFEVTEKEAPLSVPRASPVGAKKDPDNKPSATTPVVYCGRGQFDMTKKLICCLTIRYGTADRLSGLAQGSIETVDLTDDVSDNESGPEKSPGYLDFDMNDVSEDKDKEKGGSDESSEEPELEDSRNIKKRRVETTNDRGKEKEQTSPTSSENCASSSSSSSGNSNTNGKPNSNSNSNSSPSTSSSSSKSTSSPSSASSSSSNTKLNFNTQQSKPSPPKKIISSLKVTPKPKLAVARKNSTSFSSSSSCSSSSSSIPNNKPSFIDLTDSGDEGEPLIQHHNYKTEHTNYQSSDESSEIESENESEDDENDEEEEDDNDGLNFTSPFEYEFPENTIIEPTDVKYVLTTYQSLSPEAQKLRNNIRVAPPKTKKVFSKIIRLEQNNRHHIDLTQKYLSVFIIGEDDRRVALRGGRGVRARVPIANGTVIGPYAGKFTTESEHNERTTLFSKLAQNTYAHDISLVIDKKNLLIDASKYGNRARFINDPMIDINKPYSDKQNQIAEPNVKLKEVIHESWPYLLIVAIKNIQPGAEILMKYGEGYWEAMFHIIRDHNQLKKFVNQK